MLVSGLSTFFWILRYDARIPRTLEFESKQEEMKAEQR